MNNIFTIGWNMVKRTIGSRKGLLLHILLPSLVVAGIVSVTGGMEDSTAVLLYTNKDTGAAGNHLIVELENSGDYKLVERSDEADLKEGVTSQDGAAGLWIPEGFTSGILQGKRRSSPYMS